jgi:hypothetical protein
VLAAYVGPFSDLLPANEGAKTAYLGGFGRHFRSRFFADICGALKLFVKVAMIPSDTF